MINYLQTSKNEKLKDIRKINEFKGKNIKFSIVKKSSTIYKDELPEINLPKPSFSASALALSSWYAKQLEIPIYRTLPAFTALFSPSIMSYRGVA